MQGENEPPVQVAEPSPPPMPVVPDHLVNEYEVIEHGGDKATNSRVFLCFPVSFDFANSLSDALVDMSAVRSEWRPQMYTASNLGV